MARYIEGLEFKELLEDELLQRGIIRSLEIIGEASKSVSHELKAEHPEIEWRLMAGMRDKLIHRYYIGSAEGHEYPNLQVGDEVNPRRFLR